MFIAIGLSSYNIALYHLINHAFYKGLLFLGAGAVIHAVADNQDLRKYGGLQHYLPLTYSVMLIACLSLVAFPFMTGFYSKDFILESAYGQFYFSSAVVYLIAIIGAIFTTLYSVKILYLTFLSKPNGPSVNYNKNGLILQPLNFRPSYYTAMPTSKKWNKLTHTQKTKLIYKPLYIHRNSDLTLYFKAITIFKYYIAKCLGKPIYNHYSFYNKDIKNWSPIFVPVFESQVNKFWYISNLPTSSIVAQESGIFMCLPLIVLAIFSVFFGYITKDIFIGLGSGFFADNCLFVHPSHEILLDTEFAVPSLFKLLPLIFTILLSAISILLLEFLPKLLVYFKFSSLGYNLFSFFNQRLLIELFYNKYIIGLILKLGGHTTKVIDKGSVELLGPYGLEKGLLSLSKNIAKLDSGIITSYALYILLGLIFYILLPYLSLSDNSLLLLILFGIFTFTSHSTKNMQYKSTSKLTSIVSKSEFGFLRYIKIIFHRLCLAFINVKQIIKISFTLNALKVSLINVKQNIKKSFTLKALKVSLIKGALIWSIFIILTYFNINLVIFYRVLISTSITYILWPIIWNFKDTLIFLQSLRKNEVNIKDILSLLLSRIFIIVSLAYIITFLYETLYIYMVIILCFDIIKEIISVILDNVIVTVYADSGDDDSDIDSSAAGSVSSPGDSTPENSRKRKWQGEAVEAESRKRKRTGEAAKLESQRQPTQTQPTQTQPTQPQTTQPQFPPFSSLAKFPQPQPTQPQIRSHSPFPSLSQFTQPQPTQPQTHSHSPFSFLRFPQIQPQTHYLSPFPSLSQFPQPQPVNDGGAQFEDLSQNTSTEYPHDATLTINDYYHNWYDWSFSEKVKKIMNPDRYPQLDGNADPSSPEKIVYRSKLYDNTAAAHRQKEVSYLIYYKNMFHDDIAYTYAMNKVLPEGQKMTADRDIVDNAKHRPNPMPQEIRDILNQLYVKDKAGKFRKYNPISLTQVGEELYRKLPDGRTEKLNVTIPVQLEMRRGMPIRDSSL